MIENASYADPTALLEGVGKDHGGGERKDERWWERVLDMEEGKRQILLGLPMILTNVFYYSITLVSVMFVGHLGDRELAGSTLANSWATVTGLAFMIGLSGALETFCGQGYGAKMYSILGVYLQASCLISFFFSIIISILWLYTEPILILLHQDPHISKAAALYMKYLVPGIFAYGFLQNILRFLQTQSIVLPLVICSLIPLVSHVALAYALVHWTGLGYTGAPLAASVSLWLSVLMLGLYVTCAKKFEHTWRGFSWESFSYVHTNLKLALPSAAMVCLEFWAFEILVFLARLMPNSETTTSLMAICTRVSNGLGACNPDQARSAMAVTLKLVLLIAMSVVLALELGHNIWASFFSDSRVIAKEYASMVPLLSASILFDYTQGVFSGVARGCSWQHLAMYINLATFYCIGVPISALLGFKLELHVKGLWIGLICGLSCQDGSLLLIILHNKWTRVDLYVNQEKEPEARDRFEN